MPPPPPGSREVPSPPYPSPCPSLPRRAGLLGMRDGGGDLDRAHVDGHAVPRHRPHALGEAEEANEPLRVPVVVAHPLAEGGEVLAVEAAGRAAAKGLRPGLVEVGA